MFILNRKAPPDGVAASMIFRKENHRCPSHYDLHIKMFNSFELNILIEYQYDMAGLSGRSGKILLLCAINRQNSPKTAKTTEVRYKIPAPLLLTISPQKAKNAQLLRNCVVCTGDEPSDIICILKGTLK